jgi:hypothetical protein
MLPLQHQRRISFTRARPSRYPARQRATPCRAGQAAQTWANLLPMTIREKPIAGIPAAHQFSRINIQKSFSEH